MKNYNLALLVLLSSLFAMPIYAVRVDGLYQATLPVASQSLQDRNQAEQQALVQVLAKVAGDSKIMLYPSLENIQARAESWVQEYSYQTTAASTPSTLLSVKFDPKAINQLLRQHDILVWGQTRPLLVTWMAYEAPNVPAIIVSNDTRTDIDHAVTQFAGALGLPLLLPMMDTTDMDSVSVNDIVTMQMTSLYDAAKRYDAEGMLVVRLLKLQTGYSIQAKMMYGGREWSWNLSGQSKDDVLSQLLNHVAEAIILHDNGAS